jgi:hypothetical protein
MGAHKGGWLMTCFATILILGLGQGSIAYNEGGSFIGKVAVTQELVCVENVKIQFGFEHLSYIDTPHDKGTNSVMLEFKKVFK